jgi:hypothetical protein
VSQPVGALLTVMQPLKHRRVMPGQAAHRPDRISSKRMGSWLARPSLAEQRKSVMAGSASSGSSGDHQDARPAVLPAPVGGRGVRLRLASACECQRCAPRQ